MKGLRDQVVLITGATSGIGRGCALSLARAGALIVATGRNEDRGRETVRQVEALGGRCLFLPLDVTRQTDWQRAVTNVLAKWGRIDHLVNNAGDAIVKPIAELSREDLQFLLRVDLEGPLLGMQAVWPCLKSAGGGAIVNMSSVAGQVGISGATAYGLAKGAQTGLTRSAAALGRPDGIRVNSLHPGLIWTEGVTDVLGDDVESYRPMLLANIPLGRFGTPQNIGDTVRYLLSPEAAGISGIEFNVDGGQTAR